MVLLFLMALLPALGATLYATFEQRTRLRDEADATAVTLARLLAAHLEGTLQSTYQLLQVLNAHPAVLEAGPGCEAALVRLHESHGVRYSGFARSDESGVVICSSPPPSGHAAIRPDLRNRLAAGEDFVLSDAQVGPLSGKIVVLAAHAIRHESRLAGTVIAGIDLTYLTQLAGRIALPEGASFMILNRHGVVLARYPDPARWMGHDAMTNGTFRSIVENSVDSCLESAGLDGVPRLFGYAPIDVAGERFFAVLGLPSEPLHLQTNRVLAQTLGGLALAVALALTTSVIGGERFLRRPVARLLATANRIASGDLSARVGLDAAPGELGSLARGIDGIAADIQVREERLAALSRRVLDVQESERRAVARELHDEIGQVLTALKLMLQTPRHPSPLAEQARIAECIALADRLLQQVRSLSLDLRPSMLDHLGLPATLRWYLHREVERGRFAADMQLYPDDVRLSSELETTLFRIAQEALTNVTRHASAAAVSVSLSVSGRRVTLVVRDTGKGFDVEEARERARRGQSLGILGMEERATLSGGVLDVRSGAWGTEVRATFPSAPLKESRS